MATITYTVGTSGRDYSTWESAIAALPADFVSDGNSYILEGYADSVFSISGQLVISGITCDATHKLTLRAAAGEGLQTGDVLDGKNTSRVLLEIDTSSGGEAIYCDPAYLTIDGLQVRNTNPFYNRAITAYSDDWRFNNCIFRNDSLHGKIAELRYTTGGGSRPGIASNCIFINANISSDSFDAIYTLGANSFYFCDIVNVSDSFGGPSVALYSDYDASLVVQNCAVFGYGTLFTGSTSLSPTTCMTDVGSPPTGFTQVTYADQFVDTTSLAGDWTVVETADLVGAGTYNGTYPTDIFGTTRNNPPTIGAMEFASTSVSLTVNESISSFTSNVVELDVLVGVNVNKSFSNYTSTATLQAVETGTLSKTLDNLSLSSTGTVVVSLTTNKTFSNFTSTGTIQNIVSGTLSKTLDNVTLSSTGAVTVQGTLSKTLDDISLSSTGAILVQGTLVKTLDDLTLSSTATDIISFTTNSTLSQFTGTVNLDVDVALTTNKTFDNFTSTATVASVITGSLTKTLDDLTLIASSTATSIGDASITLQDLSLSATGTNVVSLTTNGTFDNFTSTATLQEIVTGTLSKTLDDISLSATGTAAGGTVSGDAAITLASISLSATGAVAIVGTSSTTLQDASLSATGTVPVNFSVSGTISNFTPTATVQIIVTGTLAKTLDTISLQAFESAGRTGTLSTTFDDLYLSATGTVTDFVPVEPPVFVQESGFPPAPLKPFRPRIDVVVNGVILVCNAILEPGKAQTLSLIPGVAFSEVEVPGIDVTIKMDISVIGKGFGDDIISDHLEELALILAKMAA